MVIINDGSAYCLFGLSLIMWQDRCFEQIAFFRVTLKKTEDISFIISEDKDKKQTLTIEEAFLSMD